MIARVNRDDLAGSRVLAAFMRYPLSKSDYLLPGNSLGPTSRTHHAGESGNNGPASTPEGGFYKPCLHGEFSPWARVTFRAASSHSGPRRELTMQASLVITAPRVRRREVITRLACMVSSRR